MGLRQKLTIDNILYIILLILALSVTGSVWLKWHRAVIVEIIIFFPIFLIYWMDWIPKRWKQGE